MEKFINGFEDYLITDEGIVISLKNNKRRVLKTYYTKNGYEMVKLCMNNKTYPKQIHRLVAEAFIPNPNNFEDVDHKDDNRKNNKLENLQWMSHVDNIHKSYNTMSQYRNFKNCNLMFNNKFIKSFRSINEACKYAEENFGCSYSSLNKYRKCNGYSIVKTEGVTTIS